MKNKPYRYGLSGMVYWLLYIDLDNQLINGLTSTLYSYIDDKCDDLLDCYLNIKEEIK